MKRCLGRIKNFNRCGRRGEWALFCEEHRKQPLVWLFSVFTVTVGIVTILAFFWPDSNALPQVYDQPAVPDLEIRIMRLNIYDDFWPNPRIGAFAPWIGAKLEIANRGKRKVTLRDFHIATDYRPIKRAVHSYEWYVSGTRQPKSRQPLGDKTFFPIDAGEVIETHITFSLDVGERGLTLAEKEAYSDRLAAAGMIGDLFGDLYVIAKDNDGVVYRSHEFFSQGPEIKYSFQKGPKKSQNDPRSKTVQTYLGKSVIAQEAITERDVIRDGRVESPQTA